MEVSDHDKRAVAAVSAGVEVVEHRALATSVRAVVGIGIAPDGLPWLCDIDRSARSGTLQFVIAGLAEAFEAYSVSDLPDAVRVMVEETLTPALMGIHEIDLPAGISSRGYVSRRLLRKGVDLRPQLWFWVSGSSCIDIRSFKLAPMASLRIGRRKNGYTFVQASR